MDRTEQIQSEIKYILSQFASLGDFRPGTLNERSTKCGKPNCHCAQPGDPGHIGWQLVRSVDGKSVCRGIPKSALDETRQQLAEHQRFLSLVKQFTEVNSSLCDQRLKNRLQEKKTLRRARGSSKRLPNTQPGKHKRF